LPKGRWIYYQEWNNAVFLHWKVPPDILRSIVPKALEIDQIGGTGFVSLVAFSMERIRPRFLPSLSFISNFEEINLRTYVVKDGKPGVFFLSIEAGNPLSAFIARILSGLPYEAAHISRSTTSCISRNTLRDFSLDLGYTVGEPSGRKTEMDKWLTERYCLYLNHGDGVYRYDIHHKEWDIRHVAIDRIELRYQVKEMRLAGYPDYVHYSPGVQVLAWPKQKV
jgi:uncharacterized protein YqjF (DUF2071 family)